MPEIRKISVLGAGALGTLVGGLVQRNRPDLEVVLLTRGGHLEALSQQGFARLDGDWGRFDVPIRATEDPQATEGSDLVVLTVKTQDTAATANAYRELLGKAIVVSLQNGINQRVLRNYVPADRLIVGMTATNMTMLQPGTVTLHRNGTSTIGAASPEVPAESLQAVHDILSASGLKFVVADSILGIQYNKLLFNTMGYTSVLSDSDCIRACLLDRRWRTRVGLPLLEEGQRVLAAAGIDLVPAAGGSDVLRLKKLFRLLNATRLDAVARTFSRWSGAPRLVFSVYQDLQRGRPTEIDFVNGEIVRLAAEAGTEAPYNATTVAMVHELEARGGRPFFAKQEVVDRFSQVAAAT